MNSLHSWNSWKGLGQNACLICYHFSIASINKFNIPGSRQRIARALHSKNPKGKCTVLAILSLGSDAELQRFWFCIQVWLKLHSNNSLICYRLNLCETEPMLGGGQHFEGHGTPTEFPYCVVHSFEWLSANPHKFKCKSALPMHQLKIKKLADICSLKQADFCC